MPAYVQHRDIESSCLTDFFKVICDSCIDSRGLGQSVEPYWRNAILRKCLKQL